MYGIIESKVKIAAVDFDGTLVEDRWPDIGPARYQVVKTVKRLKRNGAKIILWTCREGEKLQEAIDYCREVLKLRFDAVNANLPSEIKKYGGDCRKIHADIYIDDKAIFI